MEREISGADFAVSVRLQRYAKRLMFTFSGGVDAKYAVTGFVFIPYDTPRPPVVSRYGRGRSGRRKNFYHVAAAHTPA